MFITVQIPFTDFRIIRSVQFGYHFFPNYFFGNQINNKTYYRYFGSKAIRGNCLQVPVSEQSYFDSHKTIKLKLSDNPYKANIVFSRLYSNKFFFHFDIGIRVESKNVDGQDVEELLSNIFSNLYTVDRRPLYADDGRPLYTDDGRPLRNNQGITFSMLFDYLRELYIYATTRLDPPITQAQTSTAAQTIAFGKVGVFVKDNERVLTYRDFLNANLNDNTISLNVKNTLINNINSYIWLISKNDNDIVRELSICLSKLHCLRECIHLTLEYLNSFNNFALLDTQKLRKQFHFFAGLYDKTCYHGQPVYNIEDVAFRANMMTDPNAWNTYYNEICYYRDSF